MLTMLSVNQDNGPHREMAVDCPDTFIARNKTPPRYPPPHRPPQPPTQSKTTNNTQQQQQQPPNNGHKKAYPPHSSKFPVTSSNPNGSGTPPGTAEEFELMAIDGSGLLQRGGSSSYSSSYEESISKSSFDSIAYCHLHNKNNNINSLNNNSNNINHNHYNNTSNSSNSSTPSKRCVGVGGVVSADSSGTGSASGSGGIGSSLNSSAGSSPSANDAPPLIEGLGGAPPEYELLPLAMCKQVAASLLQPPAGKHRELPVDVPDSFIEIVKTPPRYPPPPHLSSLSSQISSNSSNSTANTTLTHINSSSASSYNNSSNINHSHNHTNDNSFSPTCSSISGSYSALASISATASAGVSLSACSPLSMDPNHHQSTATTTKSTSGGGCHPLKQLVKQKSLLSLGSLGSSTEKLDKSAATQRQQPQPQVPSGGGSGGINGGTNAGDGCLMVASLVGKGGKPSSKRNDELNGSVKPVPPPRDHLRIEKDGRLINRTPAPQLPDRRMGSSGVGAPQQIAQIVEPTLEQLDSIKKYQVSQYVKLFSFLLQCNYLFSVREKTIRV
ncbi:PREDICTED: phosphatidylinositol 3-kinase 2-like isoform X2 [Rhagoletis zephyria]|uniref:phosphatidylinositol 3-kinase 2-like isoform X2 n=1 Tax=Rhagoletis zephyria TaxID=28612 RepID=UPI0008113CD5|nr:PREDICTED: phosphatidylinositol 3-kinase 2-like isoform X2 [Rhagoletis zephyria]